MWWFSDRFLPSPGPTFPGSQSSLKMTSRWVGWGKRKYTCFSITSNQKQHTSFLFTNNDNKMLHGSTVMQSNLGNVTPTIALCYKGEQNLWKAAFFLCHSLTGLFQLSAFSTFWARLKPRYSHSKGGGRGGCLPSWYLNLISRNSILYQSHFPIS